MHPLRLASLLVVVSLSGCLAGSLDANVRPSAMTKLTALPGDAEKRDGVLNQSGEYARPEQRKSLSKRERKAETTAAVAAALIGIAFSKSENVILGVATDIDENALFEKGREQRPTSGAGNDGEAKPDAGALVPWIKLPKPPAADQKSKPADIDNVR